MTAVCLVTGCSAESSPSERSLTFAPSVLLNEAEYHWLNVASCDAELLAVWPVKSFGFLDHNPETVSMGKVAFERSDDELVNQDMGSIQIINGQLVEVERDLQTTSKTVLAQP